MICLNDQCPDWTVHGARGEYRPGITECPRCGAQLVDHLDAPAAPTTDDPPETPEPPISITTPVVVANLEQPHEAELLRSVLAAAGIASTLSSGGGGTAYPGLLALGGGCQLIVDEADARRALAEIEEWASVSQEEPELADEPDASPEQVSTGIDESLDETLDDTQEVDVGEGQDAPEPSARPVEIDRESESTGPAEDPEVLDADYERGRRLMLEGQKAEAATLLRNFLEHAAPSNQYRVSTAKSWLRDLERE